MTNAPTKRCSMCKIEKLLGCFHKNGKSKDGRTYYCKPCYSQHTKGLARARRAEADAKHALLQQVPLDPAIAARIKQLMVLYKSLDGVCDNGAAKVWQDEIETSLLLLRYQNHGEPIKLKKPCKAYRSLR